MSVPFSTYRTERGGAAPRGQRAACTCVARSRPSGGAVLSAAETPAHCENLGPESMAASRASVIEPSRARVATEHL